MLGLEKELLSRDSYLAIKDVVPGITLHPLQCIDVIKSLYAEKCIITYDTGLGKTVIACAIINMLLREDPTRKFIFILKNTQLAQTPFDIEAGIRKPIILATGKTEQLIEQFGHGVPEHSVLCITPHAFLNKWFNNWVYEHQTDYYGIIIDEAHTYCNIKHASVAAILDGICFNATVAIGLTATPIRTNLIQLGRLSRMIGGKMFDRYTKFSMDLREGSVNISEYPFFFINRNRSEFGEYIPPTGLVLPVAPMPHQEDNNFGGNKMMQINRGFGATNQLKALCDLVQENTNKGQRGLVFVWQHVVREAVEDYIISNGYTFAYEFIHGEGKSAKTSFRIEAMDRFNKKKELDVIFMSITESLNLDCDYVIMYEMTTDVTQFTGRAHRGLGTKELLVYFMITSCYKEIEYFYKNIYNINEEIQEIIGKGNKAILSAGKQLETM